MKTWKPQPIELDCGDHGYSLVSGYYKCKRDKNGISLYKITEKGLSKLKEGRLTKDMHNFMCYLAGSPKGLWKKTGNELENGTVLNLGVENHG